jgi:hypothetical protein
LLRRSHPSSDDDLTIAGDLSAAGRVIRPQLPVRVTRGEHGRLHLSSTATVPREEAGMSWNRGGMIRGDIQLTAELELAPAASPDQDAPADDASARQAAIPQK